MAIKRRTSRPTPRNARERNDQLDAFAALKLMRREGLPASRAVEIEGTTVRNLERYAASALRKVGKDYVAKLIDDLVRPMLWLDSRGVQPIEIRGSKAASLNGQFWNAIDDALKGKRSALKGFEGRTLPGTKLRFLTDLRIIRHLQDAGQLDNIKEIYWHGRRR
jgi:hypothetical protein